MDTFDYNFYLGLYPDLRHLNKMQAQHHYKTYGIHENRKCNKNDILVFQRKINEKIKYNALNIKNSDKKEQVINILIRTSNRPNFFKKCIESVLMQNYKNYKVHVCYDKINSYQYLTKYNNIQYFYINIDNPNKYKFNLYCNHLLERVKNEYVIFLDDDTVFTHNMCLKILNDKLNKNDLIIWKYLRSDKLIFPKNNCPNKGDIDTSSFMGHVGIYKNCKWWDKKNGDLNFIQQVIIKNKPNIIHLDNILTKTQHINKLGLSDI